MKRQEMLELLTQLVSFATVVGNRTEMDKCFAYIQARLQDLPFTSETYEHNGVTSILWRSPAVGKKILLNAHIDVVPASPEMFTLKEEAGRVKGRGVADMKFAIVTFLAVVRRYIEEHGSLPPVDILLTSDEEIGGMNGTGKFVAEQNPAYELVIIPDGGDDWHIVEEAKGVLHARLVAQGKSAHASRPWQGVNAFDLLMTDLVELRKKFPESRKEDWITTINIGQVNAGTQTNQVPATAEAMLDIRHTAQDPNTELKKMLEATCTHCEISYPVEAPEFVSDRKNEYISLWAEMLTEVHSQNPFIRETGASDGRYFSAKGIPVLLSKPLSGAIHTEEEWLDLDSFEAYTDLLYRYLQQVSQKLQ